MEVYAISDNDEIIGTFFDFEIAMKKFQKEIDKSELDFVFIKAKMDGEYINTWEIDENNNPVKMLKSDENFKFLLNNFKLKSDRG